MSQFVLNLDAIGLADAASAGHKAARLGALKAAGFPTPSGIVLTMAAFRQALSPYREQIDQIIANYDLRVPAQAEAAARTIDTVLETMSLPPEIQTHLNNALDAFGDSSVRIAVRSSALAEDRVDVSFAGQYKTVLGVSGSEEIAEAVVACWRSYFSAHAMGARASLSEAAEAGMALLVQPIIEAECAGVCQSIDPVQQNREHLVVTAAWGMGSGVADGSVPCDTAWMRRANLRLDRHQVVPKTKQIMLDEDGILRQVAVPEERQRSACLPDSWLERVAQFALVSGQFFGSPQEIEWTVCHNQLWILQCRPLTALPAHLAHIPPFPVTWRDDAESRHLWELSYWTKAEEPPLFPLEQDYTSAMEETRLETCRWLGVEKNWARKWANGCLYARSVPVGLPEANLAVRRRAYQDLKERWRGQDLTAWDHWGPEIVQATERLRGFDREAADGPALAEHLEEALAVARRHTMLHPMLTFQPPDAYIEAFAAIAGVDGEEARTQAAMLLEGETTPLIALVDGLFELAQLAQAHPRLAALVADPPPDVMARLSQLPEASRLVQKLNTLLSLYGERTGQGYGSRAHLSTPTWSEAPDRMLQLAAQFLGDDVAPPAAVRASVRERRDAQIEDLCDACDDADMVAAFRHELAYARRNFAGLEEHNHYIDQMALGQVRQAVMAAAGWLVDAGELDEPEQILFLKFEEIGEALRATTPSSHAEVIAERQEAYKFWQQMEPPPVLGLPQAGLDERPPFTDDVTAATVPAANQLVGLGASHGTVSGRARLMTSVNELPALEQGDILVAHNIGPRWTPVLPILGGLVLNSGSVGQHAAATAREYGVPAVIATGNATRRIVDGAWITVDGANGIVIIEKED